MCIGKAKEITILLQRLKLHNRVHPSRPNQKVYGEHVLY